MRGNCLGYLSYATSEVQKQIDAYTGELTSSHLNNISAVKLDHMTIRWLDASLWVDTGFDSTETSF